MNTAEIIFTLATIIGGAIVIIASVTFDFFTGGAGTPIAAPLAGLGGTAIMAGVGTLGKSAGLVKK